MRTRGQNWAKLLREANLDPPGYYEAVEETKKAVEKRKLDEELRRNKKSKRKKR